MRAEVGRGLACMCVFVAAVAAACDVREPEPTTYFDQVISPILTAGCARGAAGGGCHVADAKGNAFGNLDISTFAGVDRRRDLLQTYGPYLQPTLLLKATPPSQLHLVAFDGQKMDVLHDIKHTGGPILDPTSTGYVALRQWINSGATEYNTGLVPTQNSTLPCSNKLPSTSGFDPTTDPTQADFATFRDSAAPVLATSCAAGNCHGAESNDLFLTCGTTPEQIRWNYFSASQYLAAPIGSSELLRRPIGVMQGGSFHEGGVVFDTTNDAGYRALVAWANAHGPPDVGALDDRFMFFAHRIQPVLARKGCMMMQCHSASIFHDYKLRGGTSGAFSLSATTHNYNLTLAQVALETDDPGASRLVRKNLYRPELVSGGHGIVHRGGPLLEDFGAKSPSPALCDAQPYDYDNGSLETIPAYCMIREWLRRERLARSLKPLASIVYVRRPAPSSDRMQDFDVYAPGAELHLVAATMASGTITLGADVAVETGCGLASSTADIRRPAVSWDGSKIAFAARASATTPFAIYEMNADGTGCAPHAAINAHAATDNGLLVHDFDPAYAPFDSGGVSPLVFASTRGNLVNDAYDYSGAQRTPADPTKPNSNLYVYERDPNNTAAMRTRQLTFLLDMERAPAFMQDGRLIFTMEKREPGFYQLALRRLNLDGGDYHPLYGQRGSIGFHEVTQAVHLGDKNFAAIFAEPGVPHHGGALGIFNRSIGIDFGSTNASDYPIDPSVIDPTSPSSPEPEFFLHSLRFPDSSATGRLAGATTGVYASPSPLPSTGILVSFGAATSSSTFDGDYDLYVVDADSGQKTKLLGAPGVAEIEAVAVYGRVVNPLYQSLPSEPNAYGMNESLPYADVILHDARLITSLAFQNTPTGRVVEALPSFELWEELPPTPDVTTFAQGGAFVASDIFGQVYVRRRRIGSVPINQDGSAHYRVPGGLPILLKLPDTPQSLAQNLPRWQHEAFMFTPGESVHEVMRTEFFDGFCGQCHGAISGRPLDVAMRPDLLSGASLTSAYGGSPSDLFLSPSQRGAVVGPPTSP